MEMYYVVTPLNINYRAGGDWTINPAPEADYYESKEAAVAAAKVINAEMLEGYAKRMEVYGPRTEENNKDTLSESGAIVMLVVYDPVD